MTNSNTNIVDSLLEEILTELLGGFLQECEDVPPSDHYRFAESDQVGSKDEAKQALKKLLIAEREKKV